MTPPDGRTTSAAPPNGWGGALVEVARWLRGLKMPPGMTRGWALLGLMLFACAPSAPDTGKDGGDIGEAAPEGVTLEYIAHASFLVTGPDGTRVLIDPYASRVWLGYDFPQGITADAVVVTHPHYDHDAGVFRGADFPWPGTPLFEAPGTYTVGGMHVVGVEGRHADPYGKEFGQRNTIFVVEAGGLRIAHAIDAIAPRVVVPMHYRIGALESALDSPSDLGDLDPWLEGRGPVQRPGSNRFVFTREGLPDQRTILVLEHSPDVPVVASGG